MNDKDVLCLFASMLREFNPEQYFIVCQTDENADCCRGNESLAEVADPDLQSNFERFFSLCTGLDTLRKYVVLNYLTIHRVLAQFDKITNKNSLSAYLPDLIAEPFYSSMTLAQLLVRTECVTASLMAQHSMKPPLRENYICPVCNELLVNPVVLSCAHRMCSNCLGVICDERNPSNIIDNVKNWSRCPVCQKQQNLDPEDHRVDGVLKHFLKSHFGEPNQPKYPKPRKRKSNVQQGQILDIAFPDGGIQSPYSTVPFRPVPSTKFRPDLSPMGMYPQMNLKRKYGKYKIAKRFSTKRSLRKSKKQQFQCDVQTMLTRTACSKGEAFAYTQADMKPASCHQCKSNKLPIHLLFCSSQKKTKGQRSCHKKFCDLCLQRYSTTDCVIDKMTEQRQFKAGTRDTFIWQCPACLNICTCAGCKRKRSSRHEEEAIAHKMRVNNMDPNLMKIRQGDMMSHILENQKFNNLPIYQNMLTGVPLQPTIMKDMTNSIMTHRTDIPEQTQTTNSQLAPIELAENAQNIKNYESYQSQMNVNGSASDITYESNTENPMHFPNAADGNSENAKPENIFPSQQEHENKIPEISQE